MVRHQLGHYALKGLMESENWLTEKNSEDTLVFEKLIFTNIALKP